MPRSDADHAFRAIRRQSWLIGLVFTIGCAHSKSDLQDRLARRVVPTKSVPVGRPNQPEVEDPRPRRRATRECGSPPPRNPVRATEARAENDRSGPLPPAIEGPPRRPDSDRPPSPATSLPSDSDEATLDAIAATGKPLTLPEAIELAFRSQPRLRAQLESIAQARGQQQIAFSTFLPIVAGQLRRGRIRPRSGRPTRSAWRRASRDSTSYPASEPSPSASTSGRPSSWPSSRSSGCSSTSAVGWAVYEQARLASDIARLQTERAYQTVANEVAVAYYNVLRSQALRRTAQDALRRAEEELDGRSQAPARGRHRARDRPAVRGADGPRSASSSTPPRRRSSWPWRG